MRRFRSAEQRWQVGTMSVEKVRQVRRCLVQEDLAGEEEFELDAG